MFMHFNILRALFGESCLGDHMMSFVTNSVKASMFGISSHIMWAVSLLNCDMEYR